MSDEHQDPAVCHRHLGGSQGGRHRVDEGEGKAGAEVSKPGRLPDMERPREATGLVERGSRLWQDARGSRDLSGKKKNAPSSERFGNVRSTASSNVLGLGLSVDRLLQISRQASCQPQRQIRIPPAEGEPSFGPGEGPIPDMHDANQNGHHPERRELHPPAPIHGYEGE